MADPKKGAGNNKPKAVPQSDAPPDPDAADYSALEQRLNYRFKATDLLSRALTHSSFAGEQPGPQFSGGAGAAASMSADQAPPELSEPSSAQLWNYERLEFLGDRVLGLVIAERLLALFPTAPEGELARRFNQLVRKETCASVATEIGLGDFIIMSFAERQSGGSRKKTILGDACEAVFGAIFLDGGYEAAHNVIVSLWQDKLTETDVIPTDAKSALQEWAQGASLPIPQYSEVSRVGPDHAPLFRLKVSVKNYEPAEGDGKSKRAAQQAAAKAFLIREGIWSSKNDV